MKLYFFEEYIPLSSWNSITKEWNEKIEEYKYILLNKFDVLDFYEEIIPEEITIPSDYLSSVDFWIKFKNIKDIETILSFILNKNNYDKNYYCYIYDLDLLFYIKNIHYKYFLNFSLNFDTNKVMKEFLKNIVREEKLKRIII